MFYTINNSSPLLVPVSYYAKRYFEQLPVVYSVFKYNFLLLNFNLLTVATLWKLPPVVRYNYRRYYWIVVSPFEDICQVSRASPSRS